MMRTAALCVSIVVLSAACAYHAGTTSVPLDNPGSCVAVDVAATTEVAPLLTTAAARFNGSAAARLSGGGCAFVRVHAIDSAVALGQLASGWPDTADLGPAPALWVPGSTAWADLLNARQTARHRAPIAPAGASYARSPLVVAMPAPMAAALGYPNHPISWADLEELAANPRGWGAYGHPEWGRFRLGKGNPNWSTTGLDQTVALAPDPDGARALEQSVVYYSDSTAPYLANWARLAAQSTTSALAYLSAAITDERSVVAYNEGRLPTATTLTGHARRPALPLVAIYPRGGAIASDYPMIVLPAPASTSTSTSTSTTGAQAGARRFVQFARQPAAQAQAAAAGLRPAVGAARADVIAPANGVDLGAPAPPTLPAPGAIGPALTGWQSERRPGRLLFLFDTSDSMGDQIPGVLHGPTKLAIAQRAFDAALAQLGPDDEIGLRVFTTKLVNPRSSDWRDLVAVGPLSTRRTALVTAIAGLAPGTGSPLYAATRAAFDSVARSTDPSRIDGVVVLTDGYNEDSHDDNLPQLLAHLGTGTDVPVFTIAYSVQADVTTLTQIAQSTDAWTYDATNPVHLPDVLARALASF